MRKKDGSRSLRNGFSLVGPGGEKLEWYVAYFRVTSSIKSYSIIELNLPFAVNKRASHYPHSVVQLLQAVNSLVGSEM